MTSKAKIVGTAVAATVVAGAAFIVVCRLLSKRSKPEAVEEKKAVPEKVVVPEIPKDLPPFPIVDPHIHLWTPETHQWLKSLDDTTVDPMDFRPVANNFLVEDYLREMKGLNVTHAVHIQANWTGDPVGETAWVEKVTKDGPLKVAVVAYADLSSPDIESILARHAQHASFRGIRFMLDYHPTRTSLRQTSRSDWMDDPNWKRGLALLPRYHASFDLQIHVPQMARAAQMAQEFPDVQFILNHAGFPLDAANATAREEWLQGMTALSAQTNVAVKISALLTYDGVAKETDQQWYIRETLRLFGVDRVMFASNLPVDKLVVKPVTTERFSVFYRAVAKEFNLSEAEIQKVFAGNAIKLYRLE